MKKVLSAAWSAWIMLGYLVFAWYAWHSDIPSPFAGLMTTVFLCSAVQALCSAIIKTSEAFE